MSPWSSFCKRDEIFHLIQSSVCNMPSTFSTGLQVSSTTITTCPCKSGWEIQTHTHTHFIHTHHFRVSEALAHIWHGLVALRLFAGASRGWGFPSKRWTWTSSHCFAGQRTCKAANVQPPSFRASMARCCHESGDSGKYKSGRCKADPLMQLKLEGCNLEVPQMQDAVERPQPWSPEDYFAQDIPRRIRAHNLQSLCLVSSAFAKSRKSDDALFATWIVWWGKDMAHTFHNAWHRHVTNQPLNSDSESRQRLVTMFALMLQSSQAATRTFPTKR